MRTNGWGRALAVGMGSVALTLLAACGNDQTGEAPAADSGTKGNETDAGHTPEVDAGEPDPGDPDAGNVARCTGGDALAVIGNYQDATGAKHWFRKTPSATTYARVPAGAPNAATPPELWKVTQVCYDQKTVVATNEKGVFARLDWTTDAAGLHLCVATRDAKTAAEALAAPASKVGSTTGCLGSDWTLLTPAGGQ